MPLGDYAVVVQEWNQRGYIHVEPEIGNKLIEFYSFSKMSQDDISICCNLLLANYLPQEMREKISKEALRIIDLKDYGSVHLSPKAHSVTFIAQESELRVKFGSELYFLAFVKRLSSIIGMDPADGNRYDLYELSRFTKGPSTPRFTFPFSINLNDLQAHESLLSYLNFPPLDAFDSGQDLQKFDFNDMVSFLKSPHDVRLRRLIHRTIIPEVYSPIVLLALLIDKDADITTFEDLDALPLEVSDHIKQDYQKLRSQLDTITENQFNHANNLRISMKLLENTLLASYPSDHHFIPMLFRMMTSFFMIGDSFEIYKTNFFNILSAVAEIFLPVDISISNSGYDSEHIVFWSFISLIIKTDVIDYDSKKSPDLLLSMAQKIIITIHPLLYGLLEPFGPSAFKFSANLVITLFSFALPSSKLAAVWIAALSSDNPMEFLQYLIASALISIYPQIVGTNNVVDTLEKALKGYFHRCSLRMIVSNAIKLYEALNQNE